MTYAFTRALYGGYGDRADPSEFLSDIPIHLLDGSPTTLSRINSSQSYEKQIRWDTPQQTESRLARDLQSNAVNRKEGKFKGKILQFPAHPNRRNPNVQNRHLHSECVSIIPSLVRVRSRA